MRPGEIQARRRRAAERLRRDVRRLDGTSSRAYFRELRSQTRDVRRPTTREAIEVAAADVDVVYVGDFHAVPAYQDYAAELLASIARRRPAALGIEFVYTRQQHWLDDRQAGTLDDEAFRRRIRYRDEWGYPWEGFARLLDAARDRDVPVYALDAPPRGGAGGLTRRDRHAARTLARLTEAHPDRTWVVLFGESHVTHGHLPRRVRERLAVRGREARSITVFQNPDDAYWSVVAHDRVPPEAVEVDDSTYAVFHTSPLGKYEAYRQVLERWSLEPDEGPADLTPAVHHLIAILAEWLGIDARRRRIRHRAGWVDTLQDAFPEVYSGADATDLLPAILREHGRSEEEIGEATSRLARRGAMYESRSNAVFLTRYLPGRAAGEGARFLRTALTGRLYVASPASTEDPAARAYGAAYNEALAYLGARLVDPAGEYHSLDEDSPEGLVDANGEPSPSTHAAMRAAWLRAHATFERGSADVPPAALLDPLREGRAVARTIARDLGIRLGRLLYARARAGRLARRDLRELFLRPLEPKDAIAEIARLFRDSGARTRPRKHRG